ncbi:amino acid ABC transporter ATP-binding/permease protein [Aminobacter sp. J44]|uniref:amino acid ABC transporter ATP-binding/permease protein n=1 Tax=Aminobacter sp. J44 TaxID=935262 RepID=UPI0011993370|nr:amino acid ABC transporter ATP-binding/permease protein [Aminobacter sp. J44]TWG55311.1 ATP-binding cassette subfamily C protein CydC [Aminobacter sp. J44]
MTSLRPILVLFLSGNRFMPVAGALLSAATALAGVALLGLSGWFITATAIAGLSVTTALAFDVFAPAAGIRFLALVRTAARYGERLTTHDATLGVLAELREGLFRGWARPDMAAGLIKRPARLLFRLTLDIDALDSLYLRVLVPLFGALVVALASGTVLGLIEPLFGTAIVFLLVLAGAGIPTVAAIAAKRPAERRAHGLEILRSHIIDLVAGHTELIMAGQLAARQQDAATVDRYLAESDDALNRIETKTGIAFGIVGTLLLSATVVAMTLLAETGSIDAPVAALGILVAFAALEPFTPLRRGALELGRTLLAARRIAPRLEVLPPESAALGPPAGLSVCLAHATVRHAGASAPTLRDVSLMIRDGQRVALVGPSGAGKSTLLALIAGEIAAEHGMVERRVATLLTQRTELFQDCLRDNLRLADPKADDSRLLAALEAAGLREDVEALPEKLDTRLGEGGFGLSGGQARRLALARLFLRDAPLWLLDEPTEGLDGPTARDVLIRLAARAEGRSIVLATHIRREAELADSIVIMDKGSITTIVRRGGPEFASLLEDLRPD